MLYPLKFKTIYKDKIWGGDKIKTILGKDFSPLPNCGETWEISGVAGEISIVENGDLAGNGLDELIEIYMSDLVGESVYERFGDEFPLLIKFIDAREDLSIQVHPNDELAKERHNAYGKTEMWYIIQADEGARVISGFKGQIDKISYLDYLSRNNLEKILNEEQAKAGDVFFIRSGRVHATGKGILLAEIQQTSDITYRIYDYNRKDSNGNLRDLHTDLALDAIDFNTEKSYRTDYQIVKNTPSKIVHCNYFNTNIIEFDKKIEKDYILIDSFVIYICIEGSFSIEHEGGKEFVKKGDTVLIPAALKELSIVPDLKAKILEVYIQTEE
ncbi:MAG: mannose-6-phosphate isomerase [Bacteroidetes bacterium GWF2_38_335]|nr:MAG: mannose-6-phosphate isomerase [Bacteroidetes bacterium GWF2_38_335]OFY78040.1 MAG: mannose-6-phosphate isomerase [Bacteroidetes bacterium RIFOXYA12_FULL_38_20]HBS88312.1 mannose-6-phosphate isomerase [Bacteroidales bacterium]